eukprot:2479708-Pyramimonas_sp.AAC.1
MSPRSKKRASPAEADLGLSEAKRYDGGPVGEPARGTRPRGPAVAAAAAAFQGSSAPAPKGPAALRGAILGRTHRGVGWSPPRG